MAAAKLGHALTGDPPFADLIAKKVVRAAPQIAAGSWQQLANLAPLYCEPPQLSKNSNAKFARSQKPF